MAGVKRNESESSIQRKILEALRVKRVLAWRLNSGKVRVGAHYVQGSPNGTPDIIVHLGGSKFCFLEVKRPGKKLEPEQMAWFERAVAAGILAGLVTSVEEALLTVSVFTNKARG